MNGLIVRHFYFWRREIPADRIWTDRDFDDQFEVLADGGLRFIKPSSIVSRVPVGEGGFNASQGTTISPSADREAGA
jgi:hypothetical protein